MEKIHIKDVIAILIDDSTIIKERLKLWLELGLLVADYHQLDMGYSNRSITTNDFIFDMLSKWMSAKKKPLLTTFLDVVEKCGFVNAAGKNSTTF